MARAVDGLGVGAAGERAAGCGQAGYGERAGRHCGLWARAVRVCKRLCGALTFSIFLDDHSRVTELHTK